MRAGRQQAFAFRTRGGARKGAGRKRSLSGPPRVPHRKRPHLAGRFPVHVTTRVCHDVPRLRNFDRCAVIRRAMFAVMDDPGFRICEFSVQKDHLHLICEANSGAGLARGVKRFKQRVARGINRQLGGRRGAVFLDRYHMEILRSPRQTRNTLVYVLQNGRKHGEFVAPGRGDPFSSAFWFDGWMDAGWKDGLLPPSHGCCVFAPRTWLLAIGWRRHGLIGLDEVRSPRAVRPGGSRPRVRRPRQGRRAGAT